MVYVYGQTMLTLSWHAVSVYVLVCLALRREVCCIVVFRVAIGEPHTNA